MYLIKRILAEISFLGIEYSVLLHIGNTINIDGCGKAKMFKEMESSYFLLLSVEPDSCFPPVFTLKICVLCSQLMGIVVNMGTTKAYCSEFWPGRVIMNYITKGSVPTLIWVRKSTRPIFMGQTLLCFFCAGLGLSDLVADGHCC